MEIKKMINFLKSMTGYSYQGRSSVIKVDDIINIQLNNVEHLSFHFTVYGKENIKKDIKINYELSQNETTLDVKSNYSDNHVKIDIKNDDIKRSILLLMTLDMEMLDKQYATGRYKTDLLADYGFGKMKKREIQNNFR